MGKRPNGDGSIYFNAAKKRWIAEIIVGYTKAGRRILRSMSAVSQAEAVKNLDTLKRRYAFGPAADAGKMTLSRWLEIYMQSRESEIKTRTLISYQHDADYIRRTPAANVKIENLTPTIIAAALNVYRGHPRIAAGCLTLIKAACRRALADGVITRNPAFGVKMPRNAYRGKIVTLTPEQVAALCAAADRQTQILIKIGYATGARPEELCGRNHHFARRRLPGTGREPRPRRASCPDRSKDPGKPPMSPCAAAPHPRPEGMAARAGGNDDKRAETSGNGGDDRL